MAFLRNGQARDAARKSGGESDAERQAESGPAGGQRAEGRNRVEPKAEGRKAEEQQADRPKSKEETRWERVSNNLKTIGGAVLLALVIRTVLFEAFEIEGPSMEPTLLNGDRVVVAKFYYGLFLPLQRQSALTWGRPELGDVVIIKSPADNVDIVKRVVGLPGDTIAFRDGRVIRNGKPMKARDVGACQKGRGRRKAPQCRVIETRVGEVTFRTSGVPFDQYRSQVEVPQGHFYVLGDHRDSSNDSRSIGMIPFNRLKGKALAIYWSNGDEGFRWERMFRSVN